MREILCFGDSNTWGFIPGTGERYPWGIRWTSLLQEKVWADGIRIIDDGLAGRTTVYEDSYRNRPGRNALKILPPLLEAHRPLDGAVIMLGTNDCKTCYGLTAQQIAKGLEVCLEAMLQEIPPEKILVVSPIYLGPHMGEPDYDPEFDKQSVLTSQQLYENYLKITSKKNLTLVDASKIAQASEVDNEHLTEEGHKLMAEFIYRELKAKDIL